MTQLLPQSMRTPIPVDAATTANVTLSGYQTIDGVSFSARAPLILVKDQTDKRQNGVYTMGGSAGCAGRSRARSCPRWGRGAERFHGPGHLVSVHVPGTGRDSGQGNTSSAPVKTRTSRTRTDIVIEPLGTTLFDWHAQSAEQTIIRDLDKDQTDQALVSGRPRSTHVREGVQDARTALHRGLGQQRGRDPGPGPSMRKHWQKRGTRTNSRTRPCTIGQARIKSRSVRIISDPDHEQERRHHLYRQCSLDPRAQDRDLCSRCARINRVWCLAHGDNSALPWSEAPDWQKQSAKRACAWPWVGPVPQELHESWAADKIKNGWVYGPVRDPNAKTHPCLVPYQDLPKIQKDRTSCSRPR